MIGYKLFKVKKGQLYPLYVLTDQPVDPGIWLKAREGPRKPNGKVSSKLGDLMYRPGWHLSDIPLAVHIGIKENGVIKYMHDDEVWCECDQGKQCLRRSLWTAFTAIKRIHKCSGHGS